MPSKHLTMNEFLLKVKSPGLLWFRQLSMNRFGYFAVAFGFFKWSFCEKWAIRLNNTKNVKNETPIKYNLLCDNVRVKVGIGL